MRDYWDGFLVLLFCMSFMSVRWHDDGGSCIQSSKRVGERAARMLRLVS